MTLTKKLTITMLALLLPATSPGLYENAAVKVTPLLTTTRSWDGVPIVYPKGQAKITSVLVEIAPGGDTGWHKHPVPSFGMILEGTLTVALKDGREKYLQAGDVLAEVVNTQHIGRNTGDRPVKIIVFYAGAAGQALTIAPSEAKNPAR